MVVVVVDVAAGVAGVAVAGVALAVRFEGPRRDGSSWERGVAGCGWRLEAVITKLPSSSLSSSLGAAGAETGAEVVDWVAWLATGFELVIVRSPSSSSVLEIASVRDG